MLRLSLFHPPNVFHRPIPAVDVRVPGVRQPAADQHLPWFDHCDAELEGVAGEGGAVDPLGTVEDLGGER